MAISKRLFPSSGAAAPVNTDHFDILPYTGNSSTQSISSGSFQPDLIWVRSTNVGWPTYIYDSIRGAGAYPSGTHLQWHLASGAGTYLYYVSSFDSNGFTVPNQTTINFSGYTYHGIVFKGGGTAVSNTDGDITSQVSANQEAGFSVVKYSGASTTTGDTKTVGHGLSSAPELIIWKNIDITIDWIAWHTDLTDASYFIRPNQEYAEASSVSIMGSTLPTDSVFSVDYSNGTGRTGSDFIAYCWHSVEGYSKVGSYSGTSASNSITTGFEPRFILIKCISSASTGWKMYNSVLDSTDPRTAAIRLNDNTPVTTSGINFDTDGFTVLGSDDYQNRSGDSYVYLAIA